MNYNRLSAAYPKASWQIPPKRPNKVRAFEVPETALRKKSMKFTRTSGVLRNFDFVRNNDVMRTAWTVHFSTAHPNAIAIALFTQSFNLAVELHIGVEEYLLSIPMEIVNTTNTASTKPITALNWESNNVAVLSSTDRFFSDWSDVGLYLKLCINCKYDFPTLTTLRWVHPIVSRTN